MAIWFESWLEARVFDRCDALHTVVLHLREALDRLQSLLDKTCPIMDQGSKFGLLRSNPRFQALVPEIRMD